MLSCSVPVLAIYRPRQWGHGPRRWFGRSSPWTNAQQEKGIAHRPRFVHPSFNGGGRPCFVFQPKNAERALIPLRLIIQKKQQNAQNFSRRLDQTIGLNEAAILGARGRPKDNDKGSNRTIKRGTTRAYILARLDRDGEKELASGNATARPQIIRSAPDFSGRRRHATAIDSTAERTQFSELAACALHLTAIDVPLLASYAQSIVLCRRIGRDGEPGRPLAEADPCAGDAGAQLEIDAAVASRAGGRTAATSAGIGPVVMTPASAKRRDEFLALMARYDELGRLLPADFDARDADDGELAGVELVFAELDRVRAAMKAVLVDEAWANA